MSAAPAPIFLETILIMEDSWSQRDDKMENFKNHKTLVIIIGRGRILSQCIKLHSINLIFLQKEQIFQDISSLKEFEYNSTNFLVL